MKKYGVLVPIAGHCYVEVEAESETQAKSLAFENVTLDEIEDWDALEEFNKGNVCYCPSPWGVEVEEL